MGHRLQLKVSAPTAVACELRHRFVKKPNSHMTRLWRELDSNPIGVKIRVDIARCCDVFRWHEYATGPYRRGVAVCADAAASRSGGPSVGDASVGAPARDTKRGGAAS